jgi:hypothetical protein
MSAPGVGVLEDGVEVCEGEMISSANNFILLSQKSISYCGIVAYNALNS